MRARGFSRLVRGRDRGYFLRGFSSGQANGLLLQCPCRTEGRALEDNELDSLFSQIRSLSESKRRLIAQVVGSHCSKMDITLAESCLPFSAKWAESMGDALLTHHAMSSQPFTKDKAEYALLDAFRLANIAAEDSKSKTRAGYDIKVEGIPWSIKTQADKGIKADEIYISKFMEMGKGKWESKADLPGLRDRFLHHMEDYERIFTLRHWLSNSLSCGLQHCYEFVEIPKTLLQEAKQGVFEWMIDSKQNPKPGYCRVIDSLGVPKFELYFDGGTERKLQIKHLRKSYCIVVATWCFPLSIA